MRFAPDVPNPPSGSLFEKAQLCKVVKTFPCNLTNRPQNRIQRAEGLSLRQPSGWSQFFSEMRILETHFEVKRNQRLDQLPKPERHALPETCVAPVVGAAIKAETFSNLTRSRHCQDKFQTVAVHSCRY